MFTQGGEGLLRQPAAAHRQPPHLSQRQHRHQLVDRASRLLIGRNVERRQRRQGRQHLDWREAGGEACSGCWVWRSQRLTQNLQVGAFEAAQVEVQALQVSHVRQVRGESTQASSQTSVTGQVQVAHRGQAAQGSTCSHR